MNAIFKRKSIRKYLNKSVDKETLIHLCYAAMQAPSAHNTRPWQFLVIDDVNMISKVSTFSPYATFAKQAPALIIVLLDKNKVSDKHTKWVQDLSAATQNILLELVDTGLGGCWLGLYPDEKRMENVSSMCNLPPHIVPFSVISLGYPETEYHNVDKKDAHLIHFNSLTD
ncbi:MAG: nitroreductase family protein [Spirochaetia bacterium]|nr:nitroreductase family protein [Spirochaetia bacterium]